MESADEGSDLPRRSAPVEVLWAHLHDLKRGNNVVSTDTHGSHRVAGRLPNDLSSSVRATSGVNSLTDEERRMKTAVRNLAFAAAIAVAGTGMLSTSAVAAEAKNVVLVHGAFAGPSSWDKVAAILRENGLNVIAVENPLTSLDDDVKATEEVLAKQDGPTVLVGHSWGGVVIGEAGAAENVSALVYVAAFAPDKGESVSSLAKGSPPAEGTKAIHPDSTASLSWTPRTSTRSLPAT